MRRQQRRRAMSWALLSITENRMKKIYIILPLLGFTLLASAQDKDNHQHQNDSTDVFYKHLKLNDLIVTGVTGDTKLKHATAPVSIVTPQILHSTE